ncbi:hypothetical protein [uncultured Clostridium sp.]|uniref:hypothetical protein n=1 Tax=uncultured Clostridium sp. TaxID=59620 RepID=UPI0028EEA837|nr:hypothetical protein [uncultured Clostridium sp.]
MSHPIPQELKGEERVLSIPYLDLHLSKKACAYCLVATILAGLTVKINMYLALFLFIALNSIAYTIATFRISTKKFEAGNVPYDVFLMRKIKYMRNKKIYVRKRGR